MGSLLFEEASKKNYHLTKTKKKKSQDFSIRSMHFKNILKFVLPILFILVSETSAGCIKNLPTDQKAENSNIETKTIKSIGGVVVFVIIVILICICSICSAIDKEERRRDEETFRRETRLRLRRRDFQATPIFIPYMGPYTNHADRIWGNFDPPPSYAQTIYQPTKFHQMGKNHAQCGIETWKKDMKLVN